MIGRLINNYEVLSLLGQGGMGQVYLAKHSFIGRNAAVKVLRPDLARNESVVGRFLNEARAANAIRHPNIIDIIDAGILPEDGMPFLLMEFLDGESLADRLRRLQRLDVESASDVVTQTASALEAAHSQGIVHRDLKPDNLFIVRDELLPRGERIKVLDFGIAKLRDDIRGNSQKTQSGSVMGTATYMSPEQCQGLIERIDFRSDIYSLGIILYEMLTGAPPFVCEGFADIVVAHMLQMPPDPRLTNPAIPDHVAAAMLRALEKKPEHRFGSMGEFQAALVNSPIEATTPASERRSPSRIQNPPPPRIKTAETTLRRSAGEAYPKRETAKRNIYKIWGGIAAGIAVLGTVLLFILTQPTSDRSDKSDKVPALRPTPIKPIILEKEPDPDPAAPPEEKMPARADTLTNSDTHTKPARPKPTKGLEDEPETKPAPNRAQTGKSTKKVSVPVVDDPGIDKW